MDLLRTLTALWTIELDSWISGPKERSLLIGSGRVDSLKRRDVVLKQIIPVLFDKSIRRGVQSRLLEYLVISLSTLGIDSAIELTLTSSICEIKVLQSLNETALLRLSEPQVRMEISPTQYQSTGWLVSIVRRGHLVLHGPIMETSPPAW